MFQERTIQESCCTPAMKSCLQWTSYKNLLQERGVQNVGQKSLQDTFNTCVQKRDPNFEAFDCRPPPWLLSSQMRRSWPATEILQQTANPSCWSSKVDSQVTTTNPVDATPGHGRVWSTLTCFGVCDLRTTTMNLLVWALGVPEFLNHQSLLRNNHANSTETIWSDLSHSGCEWDE